MNERLYLTTDNAAEIAPIEELSRVALLEGVDTKGGHLPPGSIGTVVMVLGSGEAYCVEFETPFHALINVEYIGLKPIFGESRADIVASSPSANRSF